MANCPNCGVKLKKTYWKPNCPNCNVNIFYNGMQERLNQDIVTAEKSLNRLYGMLDRAKASYIGSKLAIWRIVLSLLPIAPLFLPLAKVSIKGVFGIDAQFNIDAIKIYETVASLDFGVFGLISHPSFTVPIIFFALAVVFMALGAVASLVGFILIFLSCAPKGIQRNLGFSISALGCYVIGGVSFLISGSQFESILGADCFNAAISFGYPILLVLAIAPIVINLMIKKNPIVVVSSAEKRKKEIAEKAAQMAADIEEAQKKEAEQRMIEEAYAAEQAKKENK